MLIMMEPAIEFITGVTLLFIGISYIFRQKDWIIFLEHLEKKGSRAGLSMGAINTVAGSFIVAFHWDWEGLAAITTILGSLFLFRGFICLIYPNLVISKIRMILKKAKTNLNVIGLVSMLLSGIILLGWWDVQYGWQNDQDKNLEMIEGFKN